LDALSTAIRLTFRLALAMTRPLLCLALERLAVTDVGHELRHGQVLVLPRVDAEVVGDGRVPAVD
jgi:hypothetical protein